MGQLDDAALNYSSSHELEWQISMCGDVYPVCPARCTAESFSKFKQAVGVLGSSFHSLNIKYAKYVNDSFITGVDLGKE